MDIEEKKSLTSSWFRELRDMFCEEFEDIDGGSFERKNWDHKFEGGGEMSLMKGEVFGKRELSPLIGMSKKSGGGNNKGGSGGRQQRRRNNNNR